MAIYFDNFAVPSGLILIGCQLFSWFSTVDNTNVTKKNYKAFDKSFAIDSAIFLYVILMNFAQVYMMGMYSG
jgi:hypothetical protein